MNDDFKSIFRQYLVRYTDNEGFTEHYGYCGNSCSVYSNLFYEPVERIFYWREEDWQGSLFVVYRLRIQDSADCYAYVMGYFGSCSGCDYIEGTKHAHELNLKVKNIFNDIQFTKDIQSIELGKCVHPDLLQNWKDYLDYVTFRL